MIQLYFWHVCFFLLFFLGRHNALKAEDRSISEEMISNSLNHAVDKGRPWNEDTDLIGKIGPPKMTFWRLQNVVPFRRFSLGRHSEDSRHLQVYKYKLWYLTLKDSHFRVVKHAVVFGKHQDRTPKRQKRQRIMRDRRLVPMPSADGVRDRKAHGGPKTGLDPGCREHAMIWVLEQAAPNSHDSKRENISITFSITWFLNLLTCIDTLYLFLLSEAL